MRDLDLTILRTIKTPNGRLLSRASRCRSSNIEHDTQAFSNNHRITFRDPEGKTRLWESAERLTRPKGCDIDAIGVAAILDDPSQPDQSPRIVLQKQWRAPADAVVIEIPAGLMDPGESAEECALRELKEETGYVGKVMEGSFGVSPVMFNGMFCGKYAGRLRLCKSVYVLMACRSRVLQYKSQDDPGQRRYVAAREPKSATQSRAGGVH